MVSHGKHITQLVEGYLRYAINEAKGGHVDSGKIHFKRVVFSADHNLVVVEIGQEQLLDLPESFFEGNVIKQALLAHSNCSRVDIMDLGKSTNIYYWLRPNEQDEKAEALNLAYAI